LSGLRALLLEGRGRLRDMTIDARTTRAHAREILAEHQQALARAERAVAEEKQRVTERAARARTAEDAYEAWMNAPAGARPADAPARPSKSLDQIEREGRGELARLRIAERDEELRLDAVKRAFERLGFLS
jgi:hypothetical protein